jgi:predicted MFS family arabinose efflux permease
MKLSYKARRRWSLVLLLVGLPLYIAAALFVVSLFDRPPFWLEFVTYVFLGFLWMLPFKFVFLGVGKADPDAAQDAKSQKAQNQKAGE